MVNLGLKFLDNPGDFFFNLHSDNEDSSPLPASDRFGFRFSGFPTFLPLTWANLNVKAKVLSENGDTPQIDLTGMYGNLLALNAVSGDAYTLTGAGSVGGQSLFLTGDGSGTLGLQAPASFASATIDTGSTLDIGYSGIDGSLQANNITNNGAISFFNAAGTLTVAARLAGSGAVSQYGSAVTVLSATNSIYSIGVINAGSLAIACAPTGAIVNNSELQPNSAVDFTIPNNMTGLGNYHFTGFQTTTLTGVSDHTGRNWIQWGKVVVDNPQALGGYREYKTTELEEIAAGLGLPYELMTGDLSKVNYSSWRGGQLGFRNTIENYRWLTLIPMFCMPVRRRVIDTLVLLGKIPARVVDDPAINLYATQWTAPRFESVDPVKDAEAALKDIRMGRITWFEAVLANGYDPNAQLAQIALFNKRVDKFEIILDCDPRNTTLRGQEQPAATEERTPSSKAATGKPKGQGMDALSEEDLGMVRELLVAGASHRATRDWAAATRTYLT